MNNKGTLKLYSRIYIYTSMLYVIYIYVYVYVYVYVYTRCTVLLGQMRLDLVGTVVTLRLIMVPSQFDLQF